MLFHRFQAWNLAYALYQDQKMGAQRSPFVEHRFVEGLQQGWMRPALWREALEMFVVDETPLLPPDLDIDPRPIKGHLKWMGEVEHDLSVLTMARYKLPELRSLRGLITANLNRRGVALTALDFDRILVRLEQMPEQIRWAARGDVLREIELEFTMASLSLELARRGIPTYVSSLPESLGQEAPGSDSARDTDAFIAKFYFENQVQVPSPATFSDAIKVREHNRIQSWRMQVRSWSDKLKSDSLDFADIKREIDDANGYIQGASFPTRMLPKWSSLVIVPAAFYHTFIASEEWAHIVGGVLFSIEAFRLFGEVITKAVSATEPLEYKWFLVSNVE